MIMAIELYELKLVITLSYYNGDWNENKILPDISSSITQISSEENNRRNGRNAKTLLWII